MPDGEIAYYPYETRLYNGALRISEETDGPENSAETRISVVDRPELELIITPQILHPLRVQHVGHFVRQDVLPQICNVDLELDPQPGVEEVARAILATRAAPITC